MRPSTDVATTLSTWRPGFARAVLQEKRNGGRRSTGPGPAVDCERHPRGLGAPRPHAEPDPRRRLHPRPRAGARQGERLVVDQRRCAFDVVAAGTGDAVHLQPVGPVGQFGRVEGIRERSPAIDVDDPAVDDELDPLDVGGGLCPPGDDPAQRPFRHERLHAQADDTRVAADEAEVALPLPVGAGVAVVARAAAAAAAVRDLVMADHVPAVDRHQRAPRDPRGQARRGVVLRCREPEGGVREALVLDPDGQLVRPPVAGVPRDVGQVDELDDLAPARDDVVRGRMRPRVAQPAHRPPEASLGDVDDDSLERVDLAVGRGEVPCALQPDDGRASADGRVRRRDEEERGRDRRGEDLHPAGTHPPLTVALVRRFASG